MTLAALLLAAAPSARAQGIVLMGITGETARATAGRLARRSATTLTASALGYSGGEAALDPARGRELSIPRALRALKSRAFLADTAGFIGGFYATQAVLPRLLPRLGLPGLVGSAVFTAFAATAGGEIAASATGRTLGGAGGKLDPVDLVGRPTAIGIGAAIGTAVFPGVGSLAGAVAGGIVGELGWELVYRKVLKRGPQPRRAVARPAAPPPPRSGAHSAPPLGI